LFDFLGTKEETTLVFGKSNVASWLPVSCSSCEESWQLFTGMN